MEAQARKAALEALLSFVKDKEKEALSSKIKPKGSAVVMIEKSDEEPENPDETAEEDGIEETPEESKCPHCGKPIPC
jgi:hypothetical protein